MRLILQKLGRAALLAAGSGPCLGAGPNLLTNPGFDGGIAGWGGNSFTIGWSPLDASGAAGSGSATVISDIVTPISYAGESIRQCVPVVGGHVYDFSARTLIPAGQPRTGRSIAVVRFGTSCTLNDFTALDSSAAFSVAVVGEWTLVEGRGLAPPLARFATLQLANEKVEAGDVLKVHFDDAFFGESEATCPALWSSRNQPPPPGPLFGAPMIWDAARSRTLLFGGSTGTAWKGDTWTWDGVTWALAAAAGPSPRAHAAAAWDSARARGLLFGGRREMGGATELFPDTWEWDGTAWTARTGPGPPGRCCHAMAYDALRDRVVLFGGEADHRLLGDTWEWDGSAWTEIGVPGEKPVARSGHAMAYDASRGRVVLFGGAVEGGPTDETWEWDGVRWSRVESARRPSPRSEASLAFDASRGKLLLYGGALGPGLYAPPEVWLLDARGWSLTAEVGPRSVRSGGMAYDAARRRMVVFGGLMPGERATTGTAERIAPAPAERLVPIVLDVVTASAHFTTELAIANRGAEPADVTLRYTASLGDRLGSGTAFARVEAGAQLLIPDVLAFLRDRGLPIPPAGGGQQGGSLLLGFPCLGSRDDVAVTARTTTGTRAPQPEGSAGLAYDALDPAEASSSALVVHGLRADAADRSNVAVFSASPEPVTLRVTAVSGAGAGARAPLEEALVLGPYEWRQFSFGLSGLANGRVLVERVAGTGTFGAYGVVNDNATNDGSFVLPATARPTPSRELFVPVLVETPAFRSELVLASSADVPVRLDLALVESLSGAARALEPVSVDLAPGEQRILPEAVEFLRQRGAAVGPAGAARYGGALRVTVSGATAAEVYAGARTAAPSAAGGRFGLFTPPVLAEAAATEAAVLYGLRADGSNRSNVAVVSMGSPGSGPIELSLQAYDGDAGGLPKGAAVVASLAPGQWAQFDGFLAAAGVANGWVVLRRTAGSAPWLAYGVVNDGGQPGTRTGDGAYVPMVRGGSR